VTDVAARDSALRALLSQCDDGRMSAQVALMEMLIESKDGEAVSRLLRACESSSPGAATRILALMEDNRAGCARIVAMLQSGVDSPPVGASVEEGVAFCKRLFDWSVRQSEEASVALYSLGSPQVLEAATGEIVDVLDGWGVLGETRRALDLGCGIGRLEQALSPRLGALCGIDVSSEMIQVARRRCASLPNVSLSECSGRDLRGWEDASFDLVFAVDSFPYLVQSGMPLVAAYFSEFVILDFSYRQDDARDRADVASLARASGLDVVLDGVRPFRLWNGAAYRLRKSAGHAPATSSSSR
jgi:predicted TPR repeat methyltransferase